MDRVFSVGQGTNSDSNWRPYIIITEVEISKNSSPHKAYIPILHFHKIINNIAIFNVNNF